MRGSFFFLDQIKKQFNGGEKEQNKKRKKRKRKSKEKKDKK